MAGTADHPITIEAAPHRLRVRFAGRIVADSARALLLAEASYNPVAYIPRQDVDMALLARTDRKTRCPYKGEASYYSIHVDGDGRIAENAVWSYEQPLPDVAEIAGHMAFYPDRVDGIERWALVSSGSAEESTHR
jgi:uncharacterized protein (DUF427 family)